MKSLKILVPFVALLVMSSCVTSKKFASVNDSLKKLQAEAGIKADSLKTALMKSEQLANQVADLKKQLGAASKNNTQMLNTLQDLSVLSTKQAESVKKSLETIDKKDNYITGLQSAMARKDSLNMQLVLNLKSAIGDVNDKDINIKVDKGVVYIDISDKMLFNSGRYTVTAQAREVLGKVAKVLNAHPDFDFMVEGHTDNVPIHTSALEDNWDLSVKRATSVVRILQKEYHIAPERMAASGRSEYIPVASNDNAQGRALNRRTRIIILPQLDQFFNLLANDEGK